MILKENNYGKARVRLAKIIRKGDFHAYKNYTIETKLWGDLEKAYTEGDNSGVLPTDTQKNTVYALAADHSLETPESFALHLSAHFIDTVPHLSRVDVTIEEELFQRIELDGVPHQHAFTGGRAERQTVYLSRTRDRVELMPGIKNLILLKTTNSAFVGFYKDKYTVLPEERDRIMGTSVTASWRLSSIERPFDADRATVRANILRVFATHDSESVQHTLFEMGKAILAAVDGIEEITFSMPNIHNIPFDLSRIGLENKNEIFVPIDEPHGTIEGTVARSDNG